MERIPRHGKACGSARSMSDSQKSRPNSNFLTLIIRRSLYQENIFFLDKRLTVELEVELCGDDNIHLAIMGDFVQVVFDVIGMVDHAAVDAGLAGRDVEQGRQQLEGGEVFSVAKLPHFERIDMKDFPGFFAGDVQASGRGNTVYQHSTAYVWIVEFFAIVCTQGQFGLIKMGFEQMLEVVKQGFLVM